MPNLRHSVSRSRSTPTSPRRGRDVPTHAAATCAPCKAGIRGRKDATSAIGATTMPQASPGGPRAACRRGEYARPKAAQATEGWAEVEAVFAPLGNLCLSAVHLRRRPKASSRRCKKEKVICQISSNSVWHFLRSAKASLRPLRGVSDGQGCRPGPANTGVRPQPMVAPRQGLHPRPP